MFTAVRKPLAVLVLAAAAVAVVALNAGAQTLIAYFTSSVPARSVDEWTRFVAPGFHRLEVIGDGDTDLDCYVYDRFGTLIGADTDRTDHCIIDWAQGTSSHLLFRIENLGTVYNRYQFRLR
jgi:hypothetical protein